MEFKIKNKIFISLHLCLILGFFISASSCTKITTTTKNNEDTTITLSSINDPDGDGDARGKNYFPKKRKATGNKIFIFDPNFRAWAVYTADGIRLNTGKASGGARYCPDVGRACKTVSGEFKIYREGGADCASSKYPISKGGGAPMPYCMHFRNG